MFIPSNYTPEHTQPYRISSMHENRINVTYYVLLPKTITSPQTNYFACKTLTSTVLHQLRVRHVSNHTCIKREGK